MENSTAQSLLISLAIVVAVFVGGFFAYQQGMLDPVIEQIGIMVFKAKAEAEKKKRQAQGMKAGQDFVDGERNHSPAFLPSLTWHSRGSESPHADDLADQLKGNKQAADVAGGIGSIGGLKKQL
ncbi:uncharacterized protein ColSpa_08708 [Colletotrichum spaethianum]|uniref:Uncharacterized protein n=1 Tax=Colletotrichum spaethianum TaxID=700344 RepID=A0AA37UQC7_9PEZI|nr:uncharacterized protein ColSpa_08708 [Colletotrichum spaethianum]GKT48527.1 hypothetical protein ColSpa_08708 [Colletotrichum spaethianum]